MNVDIVDPRSEFDHASTMASGPSSSVPYSSEPSGQSSSPSFTQYAGISVPSSHTKMSSADESSS